jgi:hypothetical protein
VREMKRQEENPMGDEEVNWGNEEAREKLMGDEEAWGKNSWEMKR